MLHDKETVVGLDITIQKIQKKLFERLSILWGEGTPGAPGFSAFAPFEAYGRIYKNEKKGRIVGEAYIKGKDYENVLTADVSKFFFVEGNEAQKINAKWESKVDVCFMVDLSKITNVAHRGDMEVRADVKNILETVGLRGSIVGSKITIAKVLEGLVFEYTDDLQPYFVFSYTIRIQYDPSEIDKCI